MLILFKQELIALLSFSSSLVAKCVSLNDEPCMVRPALIDLNPVESKYYPLVISLDKCNGRCNALSPKICFPKKTKYKNVKVFTLITSKKKLKQWQNVFCK